MRRPSGENDAEYRWVPSGTCVTCLRWRPSGRTVYSCECRKSSFSGLRKRIREPSGYQSGPSPATRENGVSCRSPLPSALTV